MSRIRILASFVLFFSFTVTAAAQINSFCIVDQPLPALPADYGPLDAQASAMFRVEFLPDGTIGKIVLIKSSHINRLDELAREAVGKIIFKAQKVDGVSVSIRKIIQYRYSYLNPGWKVIWLGDKNYCRKPNLKKIA